MTTGLLFANYYDWWLNLTDDIIITICKVIESLPKKTVPKNNIFFPQCHARYDCFERTFFPISTWLEWSNSTTHTPNKFASTVTLAWCKIVCSFWITICRTFHSTLLLVPRSPFHSHSIRFDKIAATLD